MQIHEVRKGLPPSQGLPPSPGLRRTRRRPGRPSWFRHRPGSPDPGYRRSCRGTSIAFVPLVCFVVACSSGSIRVYPRLTVCGAVRKRLATPSPAILHNAIAAKEPRRDLCDQDLNPA